MNNLHVIDELEALTPECQIIENELRQTMTGKKTVKQLYDRFVALHGDTLTDDWSVLVQTVYIHLNKHMKLNGGNWFAPRPADYMVKIYESVLNYSFPDDEPNYKRR